jgi:uncharacterized protein (TIGR02996 family)
MDARKSLLQAIIDDPDNDTPRLVYADHLAQSNDSSEQARAELIRFQTATARLSETDPQRYQRTVEAVQMTDRFKKEWFPWVRVPSCLPYPVRGFLDHWSVFVRSDDLSSMEDFADAFRNEPIRDSTIGVNPPQLETLAGWPELRRLKALNFWPGVPSEEANNRFFDSPYLSGLRHLEYMARRGTNLSIDGIVERIATRPQYGSLQEFWAISAGVSRPAVRTLAKSKTLQLTGLALAHCDVAASSFDDLLDSPVVRNLVTLNLGGNAQTDRSALALGRALARSEQLQLLERLILDQTAATEGAAEQMASAHLPRLKHFCLMPNHINDSQHRTGLSTLTAKGLESLLAGKWWRGLESLDLNGHPFGDAGAELLAKARHPHLKRLHLMSAEITSRGLEKLVAAYSKQLEHFQFYGNPIGDRGAQIIADAEWPRMIPQPGKSEYDIGLFLGGCGFSAKGIACLKGSKTIPANIPGLFLGSS